MRTRLFAGIFVIAMFGLIAFDITSAQVDYMGEPLTVANIDTSRQVITQKVANLDEVDDQELILVSRLSYKGVGKMPFDSWLTVFVKNSATSMREVYELKLPDNSMVRDLDIGDANNDGLDDIQLTYVEMFYGFDGWVYRDGYVHFFLQQPNWQFESRRIHLGLYPSGLATIVQANGESITAVMNTSVGELAVFKNFQQIGTTGLPDDVLGNRTYPLQSADFNGDGNADLYSNWQTWSPDLGPGPNAFSIWLGDGQGHFDLRQDYEFDLLAVDEPTFFINVSRINAIGTGDWDNVRGDELAVQYEGHISGSVYTPVVMFTWNARENRMVVTKKLVIPWVDFITFWLNLDFIDINHDDYLDLAGTEEHGIMSYCLNDKAGGFAGCGTEKYVADGNTLGIVSTAGEHVSWADWDGDGRKDIWSSFWKGESGTYPPFDEVGVQISLHLGIPSQTSTPTATPTKQLRPTFLFSATKTELKVAEKTTITFAKREVGYVHITVTIPSGIVIPGDTHGCWEANGCVFTNMLPNGPSPGSTETFNLHGVYAVSKGKYTLQADFLERDTGLKETLYVVLNVEYEEWKIAFPIAWSE